jgi:DNA polymerase III epsilon subunit-like protein
MGPGILIGIDVETANSDGVICEFGAVALDATTGTEVFRVASLIDPGEVRWDRHCMMVHHLSPKIVAGSPRLIEVWDSFVGALRPHLARSRFFAHNATSDQRQLAAGLGPRFDLRLECTRALAKEHRPGLPGYKLSDVCQSLSIPLVQAHRAAADAEAAARVAHRLLSIAVPVGPATPRTVGTVAARPDLQTANRNRGRKSDWAEEPTVGSTLAGQTIVITGEFSNGWKRVDAKRRIKQYGGTPTDSVSRFTTLVVVAGVGEPLLPQHFTTAKAKDALKFGARVISEPEFLRLIGANAGRQA